MNFYFDDIPAKWFWTLGLNDSAQNGPFDTYDEANADYTEFQNNLNLAGLITSPDVAPTQRHDANLATPQGASQGPPNTAPWTPRPLQPRAVAPIAARGPLLKIVG